MLDLVYALLRAPNVRWGATRTFVINECFNTNPLLPLSIFHIEGLAAADVTQQLTDPVRGLAYFAVCVGVAIAAGISCKLIAHIGTRPLIVAGPLLAACAVYYLSRIPVHGSYLTDLLPGLVTVAIGLGSVFVGVTTAANAGVPPETAGLAASVLTSAIQLLITGS